MLQVCPYGVLVRIDDESVRALQLNGTVGAGKTATADAIGELLAGRDTPYAVIDLDWLRNAGPVPEHDRFNSRLGLRNLASVVGNFRASGTQRFVLAGVLETAEDRRRTEDALGMPLTVVRLVVDVAGLRERLLVRHPPGGVRDWHLHRSGELNTILDRVAVDDVIIEVRDDDPAAVAVRVLDAVGWM